MFFIRRIVGDSMSPALKSRQVVVFKKSRRFKPGQIIIANIGKKEVVKRLLWQTKRGAYLQGDNYTSVDSFVDLQALKGILILKLRRRVNNH